MPPSEEGAPSGAPAAKIAIPKNILAEELATEVVTNVSSDVRTAASAVVQACLTGGSHVPMRRINYILTPLTGEEEEVDDFCERVLKAIESAWPSFFHVSSSAIWINEPLTLPVEQQIAAIRRAMEFVDSEADPEQFEMSEISSFGKTI
ncbi:hypothetical protein HN680_04630, partial [Candidatus Peregrinibacteria bacterium]|nr:hypothetical protein [Candidatus Peregrinibacteria bacterium]